MSTIFDFEERNTRADWLSSFCARRAVQPPEGPPFPALIRGQSPGDWIIDQFNKMAGDGHRRENLRNTVAELIRSHGGTVAEEDRDQVVGVLLNVAAELNFIEILSALAGWVRSGWLNEKHVYRVGDLTLPLRRTVWSLLIGWDYLDELGPQLKRDLLRLAEGGETGTAQMCFIALGQRDPGAALEMIPRIAVSWHRTYWTTAVATLIKSTGAHVLLTAEYASAWSRCLGPCVYDPSIYRHLRESAPLQEIDGSRPNQLCVILEAAEIKVRFTSTAAFLQVGGEPEFKVSLRSYSRKLADSGRRNKGVYLPDWSSRSAEARARA